MSNAPNPVIKSSNLLGPALAFLASIASSLALYGIFFYFATIIRSTNLHVAPADLAPEIREPATEHDGSETYVLYLGVLLALLFSFALFTWAKKLADRNTTSAPLLHSLIFVTLLGCIYYLYSLVGLSFPMDDWAETMGTPFLLTALALALLPLILTNTMQTLRHWLLGLFALLLIPICFIGVAPISLYDYSYIFGPALKLIQGMPASQIYIQYDIFLSLLAAAWMKLGLDLNTFQEVGRAAIYLFFLGYYLFSRELFLRKNLAAYALITVVIVKIYALVHDPVLIFAVTPLRLDLWLLLAILAFKKGMSGKGMGLLLGLMILIHRTFGIIYTLSYLETLAFILFFELIDANLSPSKVLPAVRDFLRKHRFNFGAILVTFVVATLYLGKSLEAAKYYQEIGIGFLPIQTDSFFWDELVMLCWAFVMLCAMRSKVDKHYFTTASFLLFLTVGNAIYFFGRSHEHNLINIAPTFILDFYLLCDLLFLSFNTEVLSDKIKRTFVAALPVLLVFTLMAAYQNRIVSRVEIQIANAKSRTYFYPANETFDASPVPGLTGNSQKVYFLGTNDFYYYYNGHYAYPGYFSTYTAWVYKKDLVDYVQSLLDHGYYVLSPRYKTGYREEEIMAGLHYRHVNASKDFKVMWN